MTATTVDRLFGESSSVAVKAPVRAVSSIANITLSGLQTVGGVLLVEGDRVLVAAQTDSKQNGIYNASASGWTRAGDFNDNRDAVQGTVVIAQGALWASYQLTTPNPVQFGTTPITFSPPAAGMVTQAIIAALLSGSIFNATVDGPAPVILRQAYNYSGGTAGFVVPVLNMRADVTDCGANYPWTCLATMFNSSTGSAQAVAFYGQGSKVVANASPTWGAAFAIREMTSTPDPTTGSVALELDLQANGTDIHSGRVICDAVIIPYTPYGSGGATVTATYGYRVSNGNDTRSVVSFPFALGIGLQCFAGFDTSRATCTAAAYMLAQGQGIVFDGAAGTHFISYDGTGLGFHAAGNLITRLNSDGTIRFGGPTHNIVFAAAPGGTGTAAAVLTANKPGASTAVSTWGKITIDGTDYVWPLWLAS